MSIEEESSLHNGYTVMRTRDIHKIRNLEALACFGHLIMVSQIIKQKHDKESIYACLKGKFKLSKKEIDKHMQYLYSLDLSDIKEYIEES